MLMPSFGEGARAGRAGGRNVEVVSVAKLQNYYVHLLVKRNPDLTSDNFDNGGADVTLN